MNKNKSKRMGGKNIKIIPFLSINKKSDIPDTNDKQENTNNKTVPEIPIIKTTKTKSCLERLQTFEKWNSPHSAMDMARAGFVYTGIDDKVECLTCGIKMYDWKPTDIPIEAHLDASPDCRYVVATYCKSQSKDKISDTVKLFEKLCYSLADIIKN